jgi:hypothetical protein
MARVAQQRANTRCATMSLKRHCQDLSALRTQCWLFKKLLLESTPSSILLCTLRTPLYPPSFTVSVFTPVLFISSLDGRIKDIFKICSRCWAQICAIWALEVDMTGERGDCKEMAWRLTNFRRQKGTREAEGNPPHRGRISIWKPKFYSM